MASPRPELDSRQREVLKDVILTYILSAEPVSSRSVARHGGLGLSSATIRNVMSDLEDCGYLIQPHTSAGRVPTSDGYHLFIDSLMKAQQLPMAQRRLINDVLSTTPSDLGQLLAATVYVLKDLSNQVSIVLAPVLAQSVLRNVELVPVEERKVLCVVVSDGGFVDSKLVELEAPMSREEAISVSNYLTETFAGQTLKEIREQLLRLMAEERGELDRLMQLSIEIARRGLAQTPEPQLLYDGTSELLSQPELADIHRVRQLFDTFSRKAQLVSILNQTLSGIGGVRVLIGADSDLTSQLDFSLIATRFGVPGRQLGSLAVFGPSRMEYPRLIPLVHYLGQALSRVLAGGAMSEAEEDET